MANSKYYNQIKDNPTHPGGMESVGYMLGCVCHLGDIVRLEGPGWM